MVVFIYLSEEINELSHIAETTYYPKLTIFGESVAVSSSGGGEEEGGEEATQALGPGDREKRIGRILPMLQVSH